MWALLALWAYVKVDRMTQMPLWAFGSKKARAMHPKKRSSIARVMRIGSDKQSLVRIKGMQSEC